MAVKKISRYEFDKLFPDRSVLEGFTGEQVEWFVNEAKDVIGAVDHERTADAWSYVVMKKNPQAEFRIMNLKAKIESRGDAEARLLREMEAAEVK